ncbi:MAG: nicotinamide-nucleotide amidohydrolase family protein [Bacteriovoracaceae bacterium]|nr:nicotinamide-nucleotide amidohydrolase family protein [Bacteriovoracaceae bacterium]
MKKKPTIALLVIGQEILQGKTVDANASWLARHLTSCGWELDLISVIGDQVTTIQFHLQELIKTCDLIITSGGMGPTLDDVTKSALALTFGKKIIYHEAARKVATDHYGRIGREFDPSFNKYDHIPEDFSAVYNPVGLAPGLKFEWQKDKWIIAAPGVPKEFQAMLEQEILNFAVAGEIFEHFVVKTWKLPEEKIFKEMCPHLWETLASFGQVSSLPHAMGVDIGIRISGETKAQVKESASKLKRIFLNSPLAPHIWQFGQLELPNFVLQLARAKEITLGTAESCTGGLIASRLTDVAGSSTVFKGSVVAYSEEMKSELLEVPEQIIQSAGVVSETVAKLMAEGVKAATQCDVAVSTTGIAGPGGGSEKNPVGSVWIGIASPLGTKAFHYQFMGNREMIKYRASQAALHHVRMEIELC